MSIDVMKQALDALEHEAQKGNDDAYRVERDALRAAIEQAQPELEQAMTDAIIGGTGVMLGDKRIDPASIYKQPEQDPRRWEDQETCHCDSPTWCKHYNKCNRKMLGLPPAPRQWQGLTDEEIKDCEKQAMVNGSLPFEQRSFFARAIEAKLKEKNK